MKEQLQQILNQFDYEAALKWYKKHVEGKYFLKDLFSKGADKYNIQKLRSELTDLLHSMEDVYVPEKATPKAEDAPKLQPKVVAQAASSPEEHQLDEEWKPLYKEASYRFTEIREEMTDEERQELAFEVLNLMDEVEKSWKKKDFLKKHGVMPEFSSLGMENLTVPQMMTRRGTLRTYISKAKKSAKNLEKIPEWEIEIEELERRMTG